MGVNLTDLYIDDTFQKLVQIDGTAIADGTGSAITNLNVSASHALNADNATTATSASYAGFARDIFVNQYPNPGDPTKWSVPFYNNLNQELQRDTSNGMTYNANANRFEVPNIQATTITGTLNGNADTATTASYAETANLPSGTISGSAQISDLGFVQSDITGSSVITGSVNGSNLTFTKGDGSTFDLTVTAAPSISASYATSASHALESDKLNGKDAATFATTGSNNFTDTQIINKVGSTAILAFGNVVMGSGGIQGNVTGSLQGNADTATTASYAVTATSADSVAYANITGKPTLVSGSSQITLADATGNLDGARITGTVSNATNAVSASIANTATTAVLATSAVSAVSASHAVIADSSLTSNTSISASHAVNADIVGLFNKDILDGTAYQVLRTDGAGNISFDYADRTNIEVRTIEAVTKGDPLRVVGFNNGQNRVEVRKADASNSALMPAYGVAYETIGANQNTQMVALGALDDVNTQVAPNDFQEGDVLYVKPGGGLTNVKPTGTNLIQNVGKVARRNQNNGEILVSAIGRSNDVPNIAEGSIWVGDSNGVATPTSTGSFAKTDKNNVFTGNQTFNNINVNGTGSFAYIQSVTGSAKIIGDAFIVLNNNTPAERYAGMKVFDSGSAGVSASLEFDGLNNDWFYEYSDDGGVTTDHGVVLFGPEYSAKGTPTYPTNNTLQKGNGGHHLLDSIITDDGSTVTVAGDLTGNVIQANTYVVGDLIGNASTATTASYALTSANDGQWDGQYTGAAVIDGSLTVTGSFTNLFDIPTFAGGAPPATFIYKDILLGDGNGNNPFGGDGGQPFFIYGNNSFMPNSFRMGTRLSGVGDIDQNFMEISSTGFKGQYFPSSSGELSFFAVENNDGPVGNISSGRLSATNVILGQFPVSVYTGPNVSRQTSVNVGVNIQYGPTDFYKTTNVNVNAVTASFNTDKLTFNTEKFTINDQTGLDFVSQANITFESISDQIQFLGDSSVTGDLTVTGVINGTLQGNADTATSASYAPLDTSLNNNWTNENNFEARVSGDLETGATSGTVNIDFSTGNYFTVTPSGTVTITPTNVTAAGKSQTVSILIVNTGSQTVNFSGILWAEGTAPTITAGGTDIVTLVSFGSTVYGTTVQNLS